MVVDAVSKHTATIIFSHGLGDTAAGWYPVARELSSQFKHVKWILPTAPNQPVTINNGHAMPSWFDIKSLDPPLERAPSAGTEDEAGMLKSVKRISDLISGEVESGIDSTRIVVGGFSQGAVISLLTGITSERKLGGLVSLSGFLGLSSKVSAMQTDHARKLPLFWGHGNADPVVRYEWGQQSVNQLKALGFKDIEFKTYPGMGHSLCDQEQNDLVTFLHKILPEDYETPAASL